MLLLAVLPVVLGLVGAGVFAVYIGYEAAVAVLVIGACVSVAVGVVLALTALVVALTALYRAVAALWVVVLRIIRFMDGDDDPDDGDPDELEPDADAAHGTVVYDADRRPAAPRREFPSAGNN